MIQLKKLNQLFHISVIRFSFRILYIYLLVLIPSCINTPEDAMRQFAFHGDLETTAETVMFYRSDSIMQKVFKDSIMPRIFKELSFVTIDKMANTLKGTEYYDDFIKSITETKIKETVLSLNHFERAKLYSDYYEHYKEIDKVYSDEMIKDAIKDFDIPDIIKFHNLIIKTPKRDTVRKIKLADEKYRTYLDSLNVYEAALFYSKSNKLFSNLDSFFVDYFLPKLEYVPYPVLKKINDEFIKAPFYPTIQSLLLKSKNSFLCQIKDEIELNKAAALEAYETVVIPSIELELDSIAEGDSQKLVKKFGGGFLGVRKATFMFGRDEDKFAKLWEKHIGGEKYDDAFDKHINNFLNELSLIQGVIYESVTGKNSSPKQYHYLAAPIVLTYPDSLVERVKQYVELNKFSTLKGIGEWIPGVGDLIFVYDIVSENEEGQQMSSDDFLKLFCQGLIIEQIGQPYRDKVHSQIQATINKSFDELYENISKTI